MYHLSLKFEGIISYKLIILGEPVKIFEFFHWPNT
jgi:hypothetical protein